MTSLERELIPLKSEVDGKQKVLESKRREIITQGLYLEQFDKLMSRICTEPLYAVPGAQISIQSEFLRKRDGYLRKSQLLQKQIEETLTWCEKESAMIKELSNSLENHEDIISIIGEIIDVEKRALECRGILDHQRIYLENVSFKNIEEEV